MKGGAWHEEELFTVGSLKVTKGGATGVGAGTVVAIIIGVLICMYISWRKREAISEAARRASTVIYNAGIAIRRSIIGRGADYDANEIAEEQPRRPSELTRDQNQRNFLRALFEFHATADDVKRSARGKGNSGQKDK